MILFFISSEALTILSVHQARIIKPTATKYIMQLADMKLHICTYIQVEKDNKIVLFNDLFYVSFFLSNR